MKLKFMKTLNLNKVNPLFRNKKIKNKRDTSSSNVPKKTPVTRILEIIIQYIFSFI